MVLVPFVFITVPFAGQGVKKLIANKLFYNLLATFAVPRKGIYYLRVVVFDVSWKCVIYKNQCKDSQSFRTTQFSYKNQSEAYNYITKNMPQ